MRHFWLFFTFLWCTVSLKAQIVEGTQANEKINGTDLIRYSRHTGLPEYISFRANAPLPLAKLSSWVKYYYGLPKEVTFTQRSAEKDAQGNRHIRFNEVFNGNVVDHAMLVAHVNSNGVVYAINGEVFKNLTPQTPTIDEAYALTAAMATIGATSYKWQLPGSEEQLKETSGNINATWFPKGELVYAALGDVDKPTFRLAWKFDIYAAEPMSRNYVFIDAVSGTFLKKSNRIHTGDATGTAQTKYSGTQTITTDSYSNSYRLRETGRGQGIRTFNARRSTNTGSAIDFTDTDNNWNNINTNQDEVATDAHFAAEATYDYFQIKFGRNGIDDGGFRMISYVHYDFDFMNAFWDGYAMHYGDGDGVNVYAFTSLDIGGHEIAHGLTEYTAGLAYQAESGALNEAFSDIFGTAVEFYALGNQGNWLIGEDIDPQGYGLRTMSNPNYYQYPDTYGGTYWEPTTGFCDDNNDYCGVHTNSSVANYWFYLLTKGGIGTNDNGQTYSVSGISIAKSEAIAYRTLTYYLTYTSDFEDARFYSLIAAADLYGACSNEYTQTGNAWYAVGVGTPIAPTVDADFTAQTIICDLTTDVLFNNTSTGGGSYVWSFGDGSTSTQTNPTHRYTSNGTYTVTLIATGCNGVKDTLVRNNYITVSTSSTACNFYVMSSNFGQSSNCEGRVLDSGGAFGNYNDNEIKTFVIQPTGALSVTLTFTRFSTEDTYDYLYIYNGPTANSQLIGTYSGQPNIPNITSTGGAITLKFVSDTYVNDEGFDIHWTCTSNNVPPVANFNLNSTTNCSTTYQFTDASTNSPTSWSWDFGDGNTSTQQNPIHTYSTPGTYTAKLVSTNAYGNSTFSMPITVLGLLPLFNVPDTVNLGVPLYITNATQGNAIAYLWDFGNGTTSNSNDATITFTDGGWTTVVLTAYDANGCEYTSSKQIWVLSPNAINDREQVFNISVFPNPTKDMVSVNFQAPTQTAGSVSLYNTLGEVIGTYAYRVNATTINIDMSRIAGGVYLLKLDGEKGATAIRVVKY